MYCAAVLQCARGAPPSLVARAAAGSVALLGKLVACSASVSGPASTTSAVEADTAVDWSPFAAEKGTFPLLHAVWFGWEAVTRLLQKGADVNEADSDGGCMLFSFIAAMHYCSPQLARSAALYSGTSAPSTCADAQSLPQPASLPACLPD